MNSYSAYHDFMLHNASGRQGSGDETLVSTDLRNAYKALTIIFKDANSYSCLKNAYYYL